MVQMNLQSQGIMSVQSEQLSWLGQMQSSEMVSEHMPLSSNPKVMQGTGGIKVEESLVMETQTTLMKKQAGCCENVVKQGPHTQDIPMERVATVDDSEKRFIQETQVVDLRQLSNASLLQMANDHRYVGLVGSASEDVWAGGLLDRVCLPPGRKSVLPFTMGGDPLCVKAWRSIVGVGAQSSPKFDGEPNAGEMGGVAQYVPTVGIEGVPDEQRPFTAALEHFLQQRISIPIMSSTADILSLERLFREVSSLGGHATVSLSGRWGSIAQRLQGNSDLGECIQQIYMYYLSPLEDCMPQSNPVIKAQSWMERWVKKQHALRTTFMPFGDEGPGLSCKRMKLSEESTVSESYNFLQSMARDPLGISVPSQLGAATLCDETSEIGFQEYNTLWNTATADWNHDDFVHEQVPWLLICTYSNSLRNLPGSGRVAPLLKPPVPLPIQLPFSLLASAGLTQKNTGKKTWLADSSGKRIVTPKCGACRTCMKPQLKKACVTNRERLAKGMEPVYVKAPPKFG